MEIFIAALPLLAVMFVLAAFCTFIVGIAFAHWFPVFLLASVDILWICQMATEPLSDQAFHLLFVGSITASIVVFTSTAYLWKQAIAQIVVDNHNLGDPPPAPNPSPPPPVVQSPHPAREAVPAVVQEVTLAPGDRFVKIQITISKDQP